MGEEEEEREGEEDGERERERKGGVVWGRQSPDWPSLSTHHSLSTGIGLHLIESLSKGVPWESQTTRL